jgi:hypothetical protein
MKQKLFILAWLTLGILFFFSQSWAVCPQDTADYGICDTMNVEVFPGDQEFDPGDQLHLVRFPIYVTHDVSDPYVDSIGAFVIPLRYTHTNPSKYCSLSTYWNNHTTFTSPQSIFRHLVTGSDTIHNWMQDLYQENPGYAWSTRILYLDGISHFWFSVIATDPQNRLFGEGERVLLATMTYRLQDTMTICIDTCFWPPTAHLAFARGDGTPYVPRHLLPKCQRISIPTPPWFLYYPNDQHHATNGHFASGEFEAMDEYDYIVSCNAEFVGEGVTNVTIHYDDSWYPPNFRVTGHVEYDVIDHCQVGGHVHIDVVDEDGEWDNCYFNVLLSNNPPTLLLGDSVLVLADHTFRLQVSADDTNGDSVTGTAWNAFWYVPDSLQPPANLPSYIDGNPGLFSWVPTKADTGTWISSFLATDICGAVDTNQVTILVGITFCGDLNKDTLINLSDLVYLINYLFKSGPPPDPLCRADVNCSGTIELGDVVLLISYLYKGGFPPYFDCCAGG